MADIVAFFGKILNPNLITKKKKKKSKQIDFLKNLKKFTVIAPIITQI